MTEAPATVWWTRQLFRPTDVAALAAFRIIFGVLTCFASLRFLTAGWVDDFFVEPRFFFTFSFAPWVKPWPAWGMHVHYVAMTVLAALIALGLFYRVAIVLFFVAFSYAELIDITNYLNHYYLVSLLALLMCFLPLHRAWSLDVRRRPELALQSFPAWHTYLLRVQVGVVYVYAGLAKAQPDWLLHAQPLSIWLSSRVDLPLIGPLLGQPWAWYAFSWAGFLFDTSVVFFLSHRRTRLAAYAVLLFFHVMTKLLFPIGMFPAIMVTSALVFFSSSWPRRLAEWLARVTKRPGLRLERPRPPPRDTAAPVGVQRRWPVVAAGLYGLVQILVPLRHHLYPGDVLWHEQGMRFSWKVMVREKNGSVTYRVHAPSAGRTWQVSPRKYLTALQAREMSSQPDMILQLGKHIAQEFRSRGYLDIEVRVDAWVSLNGRPGAPLIDPRVDLVDVPDSLAPAAWILPAPRTPPLKLNPV